MIDYVSGDNVLGFIFCLCCRNILLLHRQRVMCPQVLVGVVYKANIVCKEVLSVSLNKVQRPTALAGRWYGLRTKLSSIFETYMFAFELANNMVIRQFMNNATVGQQ